MTDEEKKAIKEIDHKRECEVLQLQLHLLREEKDNLIKKQDRIIDRMASYIEKNDIDEYICPYCKYQDKDCTTTECIESIIEYFEKEEV